MRDAHNSICRLCRADQLGKMRYDYLPENKRLKIRGSYYRFCKYWLNLNPSTFNLQEVGTRSCRNGCCLCW